MKNVTKDTLESIERLLIRDAVSVHAAIQAAYQLGRLDGMLEMAGVSAEKVKELMKEAA